jgi:hypothetical protein
MKNANVDALKDKVIIGNLEMCDLPELGIRDLQIRIDTGAKTSSLHVDNIRCIKEKGKSWVSFDLHPNVHKVEEVVACKSLLHDIRRIKSSNGDVEKRYVIRTRIRLGNMTWPIEITLTDRSDMTYPMLFGREGMGNRVLVDPSLTFVLTRSD